MRMYGRLRDSHPRVGRAMYEAWYEQCAVNGCPGDGSNYRCPWTTEAQA